MADLSFLPDKPKKKANLSFLPDKPKEDLSFLPDMADTQTQDVQPYAGMSMEQIRLDKERQRQAGDMSITPQPLTDRLAEPTGMNDIGLSWTHPLAGTAQIKPPTGIPDTAELEIPQKEVIDFATTRAVNNMMKDVYGEKGLQELARNKKIQESMFDYMQFFGSMALATTAIGAPIAVKGLSPLISKHLASNLMTPARLGGLTALISSSIDLAKPKMQGLTPEQKTAYVGTNVAVTAGTFAGLDTAQKFLITKAYPAIANAINASKTKVVNNIEFPKTITITRQDVIDISGKGVGEELAIIQRSIPNWRVVAREAMKNGSVEIRVPTRVINTTTSTPFWKFMNKILRKPNINRSITSFQNNVDIVRKALEYKGKPIAPAIPPIQPPTAPQLPAEVKRVSDNILKNNPGISQRDAEAMARDVIENREFQKAPAAKPASSLEAEASKAVAEGKSVEEWVTKESKNIYDIPEKNPKHITELNNYQEEKIELFQKGLSFKYGKYSGTNATQNFIENAGDAFRGVTEKTPGLGYAMSKLKTLKRNLFDSEADIEVYKKAFSNKEVKDYGNLIAKRWEVIKGKSKNVFIDKLIDMNIELSKGNIDNASSIYDEAIKIFPSYKKTDSTKFLTDIYNKAKGKSVEEFVKAQGETIYRGGKAEGKYLSSNKNIAEEFAQKRGGSVSENIISPKAKIINYSDFPDAKYKGINDYDVAKFAQGEDLLSFQNTKLEADYIKAEKWAKNNGYDVIKFPTEAEIRVINPDVIKTKARLTDIYNKAKPAPLSPAVKSAEVKPAPSLEAEARKYKTAEEFVSRFQKANVGDIVKKITFDKIEQSDFYNTELAKAQKEIKEGTARPISKKPIRLFYNPETDNYSMVDGYHRLATAINMGSTDIKASIETNASKSQLTDIYNKAKGEVKGALPVKEDVSPVELPKFHGGPDIGFEKFVAEDVMPTAKKLGEVSKTMLNVAKALPKALINIFEPSKIAEHKLGREAYATVIRGIHKPEAKEVEFTTKQLESYDANIYELGKWFSKFSDKDLENVMISRGHNLGLEARALQRKAFAELPKELKDKKIRRAIDEIANFNYKFLQKVAGDDVRKVEDYFYGVYKDNAKINRFLDYWRSTDKFTKHKIFPTVADAKVYGLELKHKNPVDNLKGEFLAIAKLESMQWMKGELMRTGEGVYIAETEKAPMEWEKVNDPMFKDVRLEPTLAKMINNLISTNKIAKIPFLNALRMVNNTLRTFKFLGSAFHLGVIAKQAVADSGYLGFVYKKTATKGITTGFREQDPIFKTPEYKGYLEHGGGHKYSLESEAQQMLSKAIEKLNRSNVIGGVAHLGIAGLKIPTDFVSWMFNQYIPKVKYSKYIDFMASEEAKLGRPLTSAEKIENIKEGQNFYGMMNERLFGRSGTVTTALRFFFMAPGFAEGNYRTIAKSLAQWGYEGNYRAGRSRFNIVNSLIMTGIISTIGTLIMTGNKPKKPETADDVRDLMKIDTGKVDDKGRRIMIDMLTYDKDYYNVYYNLLRGRPDKVVGESIKRVGGMKANTFEMMTDLSMLMQGRALYDWKGDKIIEITDPFLKKAIKLANYEIRKIEPISVSVFRQSRNKGVDTLMSAVESLAGVRTALTEKDRRNNAIMQKMYSLYGQKDNLYRYLGTLENPGQRVEEYNKTVNDILDNKIVPRDIRNEWKTKLLINKDRLLKGKIKRLKNKNLTTDERKRIVKYLRNWGYGIKQ